MIWYASHFALMNMNDLTYDQIDLSGEKSLADEWILTRLNETIEKVTENTDKYEFGEAGRYLYNFIWDDFCDWYIEMAKIPLHGENEADKQRTRSILAYVLDQTMRMLHPYMPFITEEIWQQLPHEGESITVAKWPEVRQDFHNEKAAAEMKRLVDIIRAVRNIRAEVDTPLSRKIKMIIKADNEAVVDELESERIYLERFCNPSELVIATDVNVPEEAMTAVVSGAEVYLPLEGLIDISKEIERLEKELDKWNAEVERVQKKLTNEGFVKNAPEH